MDLKEMTLDVEQHIDVNGTIDDVFKSVIRHIGEGNVRTDGESLQMKLEEFAGGRWYRDRGEGVQHLWGHVQVIKPPTLIEISGPMFMSYPAINHLEVKLAELEDGTRVTLRHRALGMLEAAHREGVKNGWQTLLGAIKSDFEKASTSNA